MSHDRRDREAVIPGRKGAGRRLPIPDGRPVMVQGWPGPDFWINTLDDPDWWLSYNLRPAFIAPPKLRVHIMITNVRGAGLVCPIVRPASCDRRYPQQWHARRHTTGCPHVSPAPKLRGKGSNRLTTGVPA